jgi:hypothetical protein
MPLLRIDAIAKALPVAWQSLVIGQVGGANQGRENGCDGL